MPKTTRYNPSLFDYLFAPMSHTDLSRLYRQFATIINAGVDYQKLMSSARARTPKQKRLFAHLNQEIKKQKPLSKVFNIPSVFPEWQIEWIKVGERTGRLNEVFSELSKEEERQSIRQKNLTTILARPLFMFLIMCFVSPLTPLVLGKITITTYLWKSVSSLLLSVSVVYFVLFLVRTKWLPTEFITFIEGLAYKIPYIREVIIHRSAYRFSTSFLNTYSTGLPIFTSIESAIKSTGLVSAQQRWPAVFWQLKQGGELVSGLSEFRFLTPTSLGYLSTGQLSGSLDESLLTIKKESDEQLQIATKKLMKLLTFILEALVVFVVCKGYFAG